MKQRANSLSSSSIESIDYSTENSSTNSPKTIRIKDDVENDIVAQLVAKENVPPIEEG